MLLRPAAVALHRRHACSLGLLAALVFAITASPLGEERAPAVPAALPSTIQVDPRLEPLIAEMLQKSPTFRRQVQAISEATGALVSVRLVPATRSVNIHASAWLRRYSSGLVIAHVEVPAASPLVELIAHELEHVVEFVERVDLNALSDARTPGAFRTSDGSFETYRAIAAGRAAAAEFQGR